MRGDVTSIEQDIRKRCERATHGVWIDARWYERLGKERVRAILREYGFDLIVSHNGRARAASESPPEMVPVSSSRPTEGTNG